jgi:hypothetical protein
MFEFTCPSVLPPRVGHVETAGDASHGRSGNALFRLRARTPPVSFPDNPSRRLDRRICLERRVSRELVPMRWGLIPYWWNKPLKEMRLATLNANATNMSKHGVQAVRRSFG